MARLRVVSGVAKLFDGLDRGHATDVPSSHHRLINSSCLWRLVSLISSRPDLVAVVSPLQRLLGTEA